MPPSNEPGNSSKPPISESLEKKLATLTPVDRVWMEIIIATIGPEEVDQTWEVRISEMRRVQAL